MHLAIQTDQKFLLAWATRFARRRELSEFFPLRGNTMTKMRSAHPPSKPLERKQGSPHCFFGLPPTDDNPIAFVVIKANFFNTRRWIYPVCLVRLSPMTHREAWLIAVDRSLQISVIVFDYAPMPFNFVVERISSLMAGISNSEAIVFRTNQSEIAEAI